MRAVIAAGGTGSRLRPLTGELPKCLAEVAGRSLLERCLEMLAPSEPEAVVVVVGRHGEQVEARFGDAWRGIPLLWVRQERPLGLAHALLTAGPHLEGPFLVMHGDLVLSPGMDLGRIAEALHRPAGSTSVPAASILVEARAPEAVSRGAVQVQGEEVRALSEHPGPEERSWGHVAAGFYAFRPQVLAACAEIDPSPRGEYELPDALQRVLERGGRIVATELVRDLAGWRVNVNTPRDLARAEELLG